jgi:hypothetical protein
VFADAASAAKRLSPGRSTLAYVGGGVRVRAPGLDGTLRLDYAHGLRDGADALSVGITVW